MLNNRNRTAAIIINAGPVSVLSCCVKPCGGVKFFTLHKSQTRQTPALNRRKEKVRKDLVKDALCLRKRRRKTKKEGFVRYCMGAYV